MRHLLYGRNHCFNPPGIPTGLPQIYHAFIVLYNEMLLYKGYGPKGYKPSSIHKTCNL